MSKLNSDNPDTMPITDAVYGRKPKRKPMNQLKARPRRLLGTGWSTVADAFARARAGR